METKINAFIVRQNELLSFYLYMYINLMSPVRATCIFFHWGIVFHKHVFLLLCNDERKVNNPLSVHLSCHVDARVYTFLTYCC